MLTLGGVPEHFNLPFRLVEENGSHDFTWRDYPGGTGALTQSLAGGDIDVAIVLTEGIVAAIAKGLASRVHSLWVSTPLIWGIHTGAASPAQKVDDLRGHPIAISRPGSGSQLMAYLLARRQEWPVEEALRFVQVGTLAGAVEALTTREARGFLWERFMTQPLVTEGRLRRLGELPTPWPAFAVATSPAMDMGQREELEALLASAFDIATRLKTEPNATASMIAARYGLDPAEALTWLSLTEWEAGDPQMLPPLLEEVEQILRAVGAL